MKLYRNRLDVYLEQNGIVESRNKAQQIIMKGHVKIDGEICTKKGKLVCSKNKVEVKKNALPFVSRGGVKLEYALKSFGIATIGKTCMDIGASTGGFTDCLLKHGANLVYAVDVGHGQLHDSLRKDDRVMNLERTDIRKLSLALENKMQLICVDVSFISLSLILPSIKMFMNPEGETIALIKPQFEVGRSSVGKNGVVKSNKNIYSAIDKVMHSVCENKLKALALINSPIEGKKGNLEFFIHIKPKLP